MQRGQKDWSEKEKKPKTCYAAVQARVDKTGVRWTQIGRACGLDDQEQQEGKGDKQQQGSRKTTLEAKC